MQKTMRKEEKPSGVKPLSFFPPPLLAWLSLLLVHNSIEKNQFMIEQTEKVLVQAASSSLSWINGN